MNKKDELKIEILSNIKDEIIDRQSAKRYKLMNKKRRPAWMIPSSVAAVLVLCIMLPIFILLFSKQVPVYEGMTVSPTNDAANSAALDCGFEQLSIVREDTTTYSFLSKDDNNGNHYGHDKKPIDEIIEDDTSISLEIPEQPMYYAVPNQTVYITVHISNPDNFEILSFTLNGKKYSSYMFEDGSDMENLILKVNIGDVSGVVEYTIDAIK